jgi:hypothetical protein
MSDRHRENAPLDDADTAILNGIRGVFEAADPMPGDLPERVGFLLAFRDLEVEVARLAESEELLAVRGEEHTRTVTFDSDSMTIMIRIDSNRDGSARVDGWLAPACPCAVEMRTTGEPLRVTADEQGRFAFPSVPRGTARLVVMAAGAGAGRSVVTPALVL